MPNSPIDSSTQAEIIQTLSQKLKTHYVFPAFAEQICDRLQEHFRLGDYADIEEGEFFALALTEHIQSVNHDEHLWVRWYPDPLPAHEGSLLQNEERVAEFKEQARMDNYGIHKLERMPGSIGYIDIRYFYRPSWGSGETAIAAMNFLSNMRALIFDLRRCRGGNPGMVALISTYLFDGEPIHLNSLYWRDEDFTQQYCTLSHVPGKRMGDIPVFVLIGNGTFSAGEEFSYNLKTRQRGILVGEITGGGAHPGSPFRLHPHFEAFIPVGRAINPITKDNWEGKGIPPDIPEKPEKALETAHKLALETVIAAIGEPGSRPVARLLEEAQAALDAI